MTDTSTPANSIAFALRDQVGGEEISPATISLPLFQEFNGQVLAFVRGSERSADLTESRVRIEEGSYVFRAILPVLLFAAVERDVALLHQSGEVEELDPKRAEIVLQWQSETRRQSQREYRIAASTQRRASSVEITKTTDFHRRDDNQWVPVEKYLFGRVVEAGGKASSNVHLVAEGGGTYIIAASAEMLRQQERNFLHRDLLLRVTGREHLGTGKLRDLRLLEFAADEPGLNEAEFARMVEKGTAAWAGAGGSASAWVDELRGGEGT